MIEHKFRAWDTQLNSYTYSGWGEKSFAIFVKRTNCKRYIIEQYTGLKDKNGVEDYIGNIWEVEYLGKKIRFLRKVELTWLGYEFDFICLDGPISPVHAEVSKNGEIIGNINE